MADLWLSSNVGSSLREGSPKFVKVPEFETVCGLGVLCTWINLTLSRDILDPNDVDALAGSGLGVLCTWNNLTLSMDIVDPDDVDALAGGEVDFGCMTLLGDGLCFGGAEGGE